MNPNRIIEIVCKDYELAVEKLELPTRRREIVEPCQVAHYFIHHYFYPKLGYRRIGEIAGHKNHATVMHSIKVINELMYGDFLFEKRMKSIKFDIEMERIKSDRKISMSTYTERKELILNN